MHEITIRMHHSPDSDSAVVGNGNTLAADLIVIASRTQDPGLLIRIVGHRNANDAVRRAAQPNTNDGKEPKEKKGKFEI